MSEKSLPYKITTPSGTPLHGGGGLITKRFPLPCKEGLGVVVPGKLTALTISIHPQNKGSPIFLGDYQVTIRPHVGHLAHT